MTSATFGDLLTGGGALNGTTTSIGSLTATWAAVTQHSRGALGLYLAHTGGIGTYNATAAIAATALGTGVSVFEFSVWGREVCRVNIGVSGVEAAFMDLSKNTAACTGSRELSGGFTTISISDTVNSNHQIGVNSILRIEISTAVVEFFINGTSLGTIASTWSASDTVTSVQIKAPQITNASGVEPDGVARLIASYINARMDGASGALGAPSSDSTIPVMSGVLRVSKRGTTSYRVAWDAATDNIGVTGYQVSIAGGAYVNVGAVLFYDVTGRSPTTTETVAVRAYDAAGNFATALTKSVTLAALPTAVTLVADCFTGVGGLNGSRAQSGVFAARPWRDSNTLSTGPPTAGSAIGSLTRSAAGGVLTTALPREHIDFLLPEVPMGAGTTVLEVAVFGQAYVEMLFYLAGLESTSGAPITGSLVDAGVHSGGYITRSIAGSLGSETFATGPAPAVGPADYTVLRMESDLAGNRAYINNVLRLNVASAADAGLPVSGLLIQPNQIDPAGSRLDYVNFMIGMPSGPLGRPYDPYAPIVVVPFDGPVTNLIAAFLAASVAASAAAALPHSAELAAAAQAAATYAENLAAQFSPHPVIDPLVAAAERATDAALLLSGRAVSEQSNALAASLAAAAWVIATAAWLAAAGGAYALPPAPGTEPNESAIPHSSFWTAFVDTYEVP